MAYHALYIQTGVIYWITTIIYIYIYIYFLLFKKKINSHARSAIFAGDLAYCLAF